MKNLLALLLVLFLQINSKAQISGGLYGTLWTGTETYLAHLDLNTEALTTVAALPGVTTLLNSESLIDTANSHFITRTNLGTTVVDIPTGSIIKTIPNTTNYMRYNLRPDTYALAGIHWNNSNMMYSALDLNTGALSTIAALQGVTTSMNLENTYDPVNNYYIINTNLGLTVIYASTGAIVKAIANSLNLRNLEYNPNTGKIYGCYQNGTSFHFGSVDVATETFSPINVLPGVTTLVNSENTLDLQNNYYITRTNLGITIINIQTGAIIKTFSTDASFRNFKFSTISVVTGVEDQESLRKPTLFPNPASDKITVRTAPDCIGGNFHILSLAGKQMKSGQLCGEYTPVDITDLPSGSYLIQIMGKSYLPVKFIKK